MIPKTSVNRHAGDAGLRSKVSGANEMSRHVQYMVNRSPNTRLARGGYNSCVASPSTVPRELLMAFRGRRASVRCGDGQV